MGWFRERCRLGVWVALTALALQLALSFGHIHAETFSPAPQITALAAEATGGGQPDSPAAPGDHDYCAVCAVLSLLAAAQTADAPALPVPAAATVTVVAVPETIRAIPGRTAFQSRAPTLA